MKKHQTIGSNAIDSATTSQCWGKKRIKHYKGCAGKGGNTTNSGITEKMFARELEEMKNGGAANA